MNELAIHDPSLYGFMTKRHLKTKTKIPLRAITDQNSTPSSSGSLSSGVLSDPQAPSTPFSTCMSNPPFADALSSGTTGNIHSISPVVAVAQVHDSPNSNSVSTVGLEVSMGDTQQAHAPAAVDQSHDSPDSNSVSTVGPEVSMDNIPQEAHVCAAMPGSFEPQVPLNGISEITVTVLDDDTEMRPSSPLRESTSAPSAASDHATVAKVVSTSLPPSSHPEHTVGGQRLITSYFSTSKSTAVHTDMAGAQTLTRQDRSVVDSDIEAGITTHTQKVVSFASGDNCRDNNGKGAETEHVHESYYATVNSESSRIRYVLEHRTKKARFQPRKKPGKRAPDTNNFNVC